MTRRHLPILLVAFAAIGIVMGLRVVDPLPVTKLRLAVFDIFQQVAPRTYEPAPVRVVDIDNDSLARLGQWPWPRPMVASMVTRLADLGAAAIVFAVVFAEPDRTSPTLAAKNWPQLRELDDLAEELSKLPDHDAVLAEAFSSAPVVLGIAPTHDYAPPLPDSPKLGFAFAGSDPTPLLQSYPAAVGNLSLLQEAASGIGALTITLDADGVIRRIPLLTNINDRVYPSLGLEALRVALGATTIISRSSDAGVEKQGTAAALTAIKVGQLVVPTSRQGELWLHYTGNVPRRIVPAWQLFRDDVTDLSSDIEGQIVLIGISASGLRNREATPLNPAETNVVIHAQAIEQMLLGRFLERPDWADGAEVLSLLLLSGMLTVLVVFARALSTAFAGIAVVGVGWGASWIAYDRAGMLFDPVYPTISAVLIYLIVGSLRYLKSERERRRVRAAFGHYLAPYLVERLAEHPEDLKLGGEIRELTLMFCDIRSFTSIAEYMTADELTRFVNRFLTPMTEVIRLPREAA